MAYVQRRVENDAHARVGVRRHTGSCVLPSFPPTTPQTRCLLHVPATVVLSTNGRTHRPGTQRRHSNVRSSRQQVFWCLFCSSAPPLSLSHQSVCCMWLPLCTYRSTTPVLRAAARAHAERIRSSLPSYIVSPFQLPQRRKRSLKF